MESFGFWGFEDWILGVDYTEGEGFGLGFKV